MVHFLYFVYLRRICEFLETHGMVIPQPQETHRHFSHSSGQRIASTEEVAKSLCLVRDCGGVQDMKLRKSPWNHSLAHVDAGRMSINI